MNFTVKAWSKGGRARAGVLQLSGCPYSFETPALLLTTRKGLPVFISPDHLSSLPFPDSLLLQFSPLHFWEGISLKTIASIGGLHQMVALREHIFAAVPRDSVVSVPEYSSTNRTGASFETPCGRCLLKPAEYMDMISAMRPNIWATLADEVPAWVSKKRNKASVDRTLRWLDDCISSELKDTECGTVFGSIVGGSRIEERIHCAQEVARRNVSGYWIGGFGLGESTEERTGLLTAVTDNLPKEKPRQVSGLELPEEVLQGVAAGIDLFDSLYIYHLTLGGFALIFPFERTGRNYSDSWPGDPNSDGTKINLKATIYREKIANMVSWTLEHANHTNRMTKLILHILNMNQQMREGNHHNGMN